MKTFTYAARDGDIYEADFSDSGEFIGGRRLIDGRISLTDPITYATLEKFPEPARTELRKRAGVQTEVLPSRLRMKNDDFLRICAAVIALSFVTIAIVQVVSFLEPREVKIVESIPLPVAGPVRVNGMVDVGSVLTSVRITQY
jgi:hypothetical protein